MKIRILSACVLVALCGCSHVRHTATMAQPSNQATAGSMSAGPGDVVLRVDLERDLKNAFGRADVFGRKTLEGTTEVRFAGVEPNGEVVLFRRDIQIVTNETTMSRTPVAITSGTAHTTGTAQVDQVGRGAYATGSSTTRYNSVTATGPSDFHTAIPSDAIVIRIPPGEKHVAVAGHVISVISASTNSIQYQVAKQ